MSGVNVQGKTAMQKLSDLLLFSFSDKLKFSIKVSLSMALAYLIPLSQGWSQASTAAITVMLIAAMGSVSESVSKGAMRVVGTIIGAIIGMTLIALFPQERLLYLLSISIIVAIPLYLVRAYKGDPSVFMLTAMTMMLVFKNGEVDDVFLYGIDKTYMTIFGITVYTLVGVFLWPVDVEDTSREHAKALTDVQLALFKTRDATKENRDEILEKLLASEADLENATVDTQSQQITLEQWHSLKHNYKQISSHLMLLAMHESGEALPNMEATVDGYGRLSQEIETLFEGINKAWEDQSEIALVEKSSLEYDSLAVEGLSHLQKASLVSTVEEMKKLHDSLRALALKLNRIHSTLPTYFDKEKLPTNSRFLWGNVEHLKGVLVTFIIFWAATYFWITMNPPGGFMVVALATGLSVITTFTPIKPSMLIVVFTLSFIFAMFMYVAVLPHLRYGWELGLFIFVYSFISFHLVNPKISIFFLIGLFTFGIANEMYYAFDIFLLILLMFYSFLMLLHIFYFFPFSTRPEHLFLLLKNRLYFFSSVMLEHGRSLYTQKGSFVLKCLGSYSATHLQPTYKEMSVWANGINEKIFIGLEKERITHFTKAFQKFVYLVGLLYDKELQTKANPLLKHLAEEYKEPYLSDILKEYAKGKESVELETFWKERDSIQERVERQLYTIFDSIDIDQYKQEDITSLYEILALRKAVWVTFFEIQHDMEGFDFDVLQQSRF